MISAVSQVISAVSQVISRAHRMGAKGPVVVEQLVMAGTVEELLLGMHEKNAEKNAEETEETAEETAEEGGACPLSPRTVSKSARKRPVGAASEVGPRAAKRGRGLFSAVRGWLSGGDVPRSAEGGDVPRSAEGGDVPRSAEGASEGGEEAEESRSGRERPNADPLASVGGLLGSISFQSAQHAIETTPIDTLVGELPRPSRPHAT